MAHVEVYKESLYMYDGRTAKMAKIGRNKSHRSEISDQGWTDVDELRHALLVVIGKWRSLRQFYLLGNNVLR